MLHVRLGKRRRGTMRLVERARARWIGVMRAYACAAAVFVVTGCASHREPEPDTTPELKDIAVTGTYVHAASGIAFPETMGRFRRTSVTQFNSSATNVGVNYDIDAHFPYPGVPDLQERVSVFVYPPTRAADGSPESLSSEFEHEAALIARIHGDVRVTPPWVPAQTKNHELLPGHAVAYRYTQVFAGRPQTVESQLYLFEYQGWRIKYRFTYPLSEAKIGRPLSQYFVAFFRWHGGE